jgi:hypothetical protein
MSTQEAQIILKRIDSLERLIKKVFTQTEATSGPEYLTPEQVFERYKVKPETLRKKRNKFTHVKATKTGRNIRYPFDECEKLFNHTF